jgi:hypothetical protein
MKNKANKTQKKQGKISGEQQRKQAITERD